LGLWIVEKLKINYKLLLTMIFVLVFSINGINYYSSFKQFAFFPQFEKEYQMALDWFRGNIKKWNVIICDSNSKLRFAWYLDLNLALYNIKEVLFPSVIHGKTISNKKLIKFMPDRTKYLVIDGTATSPYNHHEYRYFLKDYIERKNGYLLLKKIPKQFELVFQDHNPAKRIMIFKVKSIIE